MAKRLIVLAVELMVGTIAQGVFNYWWSPVFCIKRFWHWYHDVLIAPDGYDYHHRVKVTRWVQYGALAAEECTVYEPAHLPPHERKGVVLNVHGGGFICTVDEQYFHSMTFLVRQGHTVIGVNYPMSPLNRFPTAVLSVLKAAKLAEERYLAHSAGKDFFLLGDSAGGNLVLLAGAAMACPDALLRQLRALGITRQSPRAAAAAGGQLLTAERWLAGATFPAVSGIVSVYGMLSRANCEDDPRLPWARRADKFCLRFAWHCFTGWAYDDGRGPAMPPDFGALVGALSSEGHDAFPPVFLCVGDKDFLCQDSVSVAGQMQAGGLRAELKVYPGADHAFVGFPCDWQWPMMHWDASICIECVTDIMLFVSRHSADAGKFEAFTGPGTFQKEEKWPLLMFMAAVGIAMIPILCVLTPLCGAGVVWWLVMGAL